MILKCDNCEIKFKRKPSDVRGQKNVYCSKACVQDALSKDKTLNGNYRGGKFVECCVCKNLHYRTPCLLKRANYFCSMKCHGSWRSLNLIGEKALNYKGDKIKSACPQCGKRFVRYKQVHCSHKCSLESRGSLSVKLECTGCGKTFSRPPSQIKWSKLRGANGKDFFCSNGCFGKSHRGSNHSKWIKDRSGVKLIHKNIRGSVRMKEWQLSIIKRDNNTCQVCNSTTGKMIAHHIRRFHDFPKLRFLMKNGATVCIDCHELTKGHEEDFEQRYWQDRFHVNT